MAFGQKIPFDGYCGARRAAGRRQVMARAKKRLPRPTEIVGSGLIRLPINNDRLLASGTNVYAAQVDLQLNAYRDSADLKANSARIG